MVCKNCGEKCFSGEVCKCGEKMPKVNSAGVLINSIICSIIGYFYYFYCFNYVI